MTKLFSIALFAVVTACVPAAGYQGGVYATTPVATAPAGTGLYINGHELTAQQKAELDQLVGESVPPGRYALDAQYNFGYEGQPPVVNLAAYVQQRQGTQVDTASAQGGQPFSMYSTDSAGQGSSLVSDGNGCTIMSTPTGSLSSGC